MVFTLIYCETPSEPVLKSRRYHLIFFLLCSDSYTPERSWKRFCASFVNSFHKMDLFSVFVTGANRGIGLEFVRQLVRLPKPPAFVFATYRSRDTIGALTEIKNASKESEVALIKMDVLEDSDIVKAQKVVQQTVGKNGLTLLINNAGVAQPQEFPQVTQENLLLHYNVNTAGPYMIVQKFLPLLQTAAAYKASMEGMKVSKAAVVNISSRSGCITRAGLQHTEDLFVPAYKVSKAALNMAMRVVAANVKEKGILVVMMCPGWVKTDLGTDHAEIEPKESISAMLKTLENLNESHHGSFMDRNGVQYPF